MLDYVYIYAVPAGSDPVDSRWDSAGLDSRNPYSILSLIWTVPTYIICAYPKRLESSRSFDVVVR